MSAETRRQCRPHFESDERLETCAALPRVNEVAPLLSEIRRTKARNDQEYHVVIDVVTEYKSSELEL